MNSQYLILKLLVLIVIRASSSCSTGLYGTCIGAPFSCGTVSGFRYPFRRHQDPAYCGYPGFELNCDERNPPTIEIMKIMYRILGVDPTNQILTVVREDMVNSICPEELVNTIIDHTLFDYTSGYMNISFLFGCPFSFDLVGFGSTFCNDKVDSPVFLMPGIQAPKICETSVIIPVAVGFKNATELSQVIQKGFEIMWKVGPKPCTDCIQSSGQCIYDSATSLTSCACLELPFLVDTCSTESKTGAASSPTSLSSSLPSSGFKGGFQKLDTKWKLIIGFSGCVVGIMLLLFVTLCRKKRLLETKKTTNHQIEIFIRNHGSLAPKRFKYSEVKKMTNSFNEKLGQGGYGSVYKGLLTNGNLVAVKLLDGATGNGEDFINEVASIGRTSHVNVVTLLGFCFEGKKRALVYEFMPNGSLDKFLRGDASRLDWNTLFRIAKGIARGLEYLHQGCNTRIVHFDIKPHNILLDEDFVPKISDFGLAKLCKWKESIVSIVGARGTAGYMAPEVFLKSLGGASHKSDVYSYGMMVFEMTGARRKNNVIARSTSEEYFPEWIYKQVEAGDNLGVHGVTTEDEDILARKMVTVSLWCIQSDPTDRPSISKVLEMLEGSVQSLKVPPKHFWSSPQRLAQDTSPLGTHTSTSDKPSIVQAVEVGLSSKPSKSM